MADIELADKNFNMPGHIDLLLSAEVFYELLKPGQIHIPGSSLILQNTVFGYVVSRSALISKEGGTYCGLIEDRVDLERTMKNFGK